MKITHTSEFNSKYHRAALEINKTTLYSMHDGSNYCLILINSNNLELLAKFKISNEYSGTCMCKLDDTHIILGCSNGALIEF